VFGGSAVRPSGVRHSVSTADASKEKARDDGTGSPREHKPLTLFHVKSTFGDIAVQPVVGKVKGAQFSLGF
jgi:hypothetical protein